MSLIRCFDVSNGLRNSEVLVTVQDANGRKHAIRVERDFLSTIRGTEYLPIGVVHVDPNTKNSLVEFSHEPETGLNRIWVKPDQFEPAEAAA